MKNGEWRMENDEKRAPCPHCPLSIVHCPLLFLLLLALLCALPLRVQAAWDKGFNFRDTLPYVNDGTNQTAVYTNNHAYPQTRNGVTFGWQAACAGSYFPRDRSTTPDPRLAGVHFFTGLCKFQVDLPTTGTYILTLAAGDPAGGANYVDVQFFDNTTLLATISPTTNASGQFVDASGVNRTSAALWVSNNVTITKTFATTTLLVAVGATNTANNSPISHLFVSQQAAAGGGILRRKSSSLWWEWLGFPPVLARY